jgi:hypothetical protein
MDTNSFGVGALLTRILPGSLVLIFLLTTPLTTALPQVLDTIANSRSGFLFAIATAYIVGEITNLGRTLVYTVPYPLRELFYVETEIERYRPKRTRLREAGYKLKEYLPATIDSLISDDSAENGRDKYFFENFTEDIELRLNLDYEALDPDQVYYLILSYIGTNRSKETERRRLVMNGILNSLVAQVILLFFSVYSLALYFANTAGSSSQGAVFAILLILTIVFLGLPVGYAILRAIEEQYVRRLLVDYYIAGGFGRRE